MSEKISNLPPWTGQNVPTGDIPITINGVTYRISPNNLVATSNFTFQLDRLTIIKSPDNNLPEKIGILEIYDAGYGFFPGGEFMPFGFYTGGDKNDFNNWQTSVTQYQY